MSRKVGICTFVGLFIFLGAISNTLDFQKNLEGSALLLGVTLRLVVSKVFGGGSEVFDKVDVIFRASWLISRPIFSSFYALVSVLI